jgi:hypothetical protein
LARERTDGATGSDEASARPERVSDEGFELLANVQCDIYPDSRTVPLTLAVEAIRHLVDHDTPDPRLGWAALVKPAVGPLRDMAQRR